MSFFQDENHFEEDDTQNLVFQPMNKNFRKIGSTGHISEWKSKGLSGEIIKSPITSDNILAPKLSYFAI